MCTMCSEATNSDRLLKSYEILIAEQKIKICQLEESLEQQRELSLKLEAQLKAVKNSCYWDSTNSTTQVSNTAWQTSSDSPEPVLETIVTEDITECNRLVVERNKLIVSLQKSQEMYRTLIKHYPNGSVFLFDRDLRYTLVDGQGLAGAGLSKELLEGKTLWESAPPQDWQFFESKYRAALAGEENSFEYKYRDRIYLIIVTPVKNDQGEIFSGMVVSQDITDKKQSEIALQVLKNQLEIKYQKRSKDLQTANKQLREEIIDHWRTEEALRESQQQLELFFSQSLDGFFFMMLEEPMQWDDTVDKEKVLDYIFASERVTKANDALLAQYGATKEEFIGLTLKYFFADDLPRGREIMRQFFDAGRIHIESDDRKFDGTRIWLEGDYICIYDSQGRIVGHFGVQRDISDRKKAAADLRNSEERFRQLAENIQDSFWLISTQLTDILYLSPAYQQIWGRTREELYANGCNWIEWVYPEDQPMLNAVIPRLLDGESTNTEYRIVLPDGTIRWVCDRAFPIYDESGKIYRIAGICEDISDRKFSEARIKAALHEKELLLKEIHHRVKNNMQVISSLLQLQAQYIEDEPTLSLFEESQTRIHSMALIHEQLYQSQHLDRIDLPSYVETLIANLYQSFGCCDNSIKFKLNVEPIYLNIETAIPCGLIINELVSNSLKYAFPHSRIGEINIDFHEIDSQQFHLSITDNGVGFPANFDVENTETLGIRLVRMLINQLDGTLTIDSQCGTCYNLVFKELNYRRRI
jgi:PAS domain S-box-containing protein